MDILNNPFIILFFILLGIQFLIDMAFYFLCYITGVIILKAATLLKTKYKFLKYGVFKETYKDNPSYKQPIVIGFITWIIPLMAVVIFNELS